MKILYINAVAKIASTGRTIMELTKNLQEQGHETYVVYSEGELDFSEGYHMANKRDKKMHALLSRMTGLVGYFSKGETKKLLKKIEEWKPDVVQIDNLHSNYVNIPLLLKYLGEKKIPSVIVLHDCFMFTGKCCHYTVTSCYRWKQKCGDCPRVRLDNKSWLFDRTRKMLEDKQQLYQSIPNLAVVGVSRWILSQARESVLGSASFQTYIYNWVDQEVFRPMDRDEIRRRKNIPDGYVVLGVSSEWSDSKGLADFIKLSGMLSEDEKIVLVGKMPAKVKLPENTISVGETTDVYELAEYYAMADLFLNLSIEESFGKVTAEALACGTPAIVYETTACPELIGENCGNTVKLHDVEAVYQQLRHLKERGKFYYEGACRSYAEEHFHKDKNIRQYIELYQRIAAKRSI